MDIPFKPCAGCSQMWATGARLLKKPIALFLKISVITTTRAYGDFKQEGFIVIDEIGYLPMDIQGANLFFTAHRQTV